MTSRPTGTPSNGVSWPLLVDEEPGDTLIEVPDDKNQVSTLPFKACSVELLLQALQAQLPAVSQ